MKSLKGLLVASICCVFSNTQAFAAVGYYNYTFLPGDNLFGNTLIYPGPNTLNNIFQGAPVGTTVAIWDTAAGHYVPVSVFNGSAWSINYDLSPRVGALLHTDSPFTNAFFGSVLNGSSSGDIIIAPTPPVRPPGLYLIGCDYPFDSRTFQDIIGRAPRNGEYVTSLDELTQTYSTTHFFGGDWDNGAPTLGLGHAAFYNLVPIPEPSSMTLLWLGMVALGWGRLRKRV